MKSPKITLAQEGARKDEAGPEEATSNVRGLKPVASGTESRSASKEGRQSSASSDSADESSVYSDKHLKQNDKINYVKSATQGNVDQK